MKLLKPVKDTTHTSILLTSEQWYQKPEVVVIKDNWVTLSLYFQFMPQTRRLMKQI